MSLDRELSIKKLLNIVQEQRKARGPLVVRGLYSPKLKAVPHLKLLKRLPLNACYQTSYSILSPGRF